MCLGVFLACDAELPVIPWSSASPAFNVSVLEDREAGVRNQFSKRHIYYLGSHTKCSCGFSPQEEPDEADRRPSVRALVSYLDAATAKGAVEMFVCWSGDEATPPKQRLELRVAQLAEQDDWLGELTFVRLLPNQRLQRAGSAG
jgi:hypothetical protein